jgi:hypothetical protein
MTRDPAAWDLPHLSSHLRGVVDLELWTVPFYMAAMYSIQDPACEAYQLIQASVHEEMRWPRPAIRTSSRGPRSG